MPEATQKVVVLISLGGLGDAILFSPVFKAVQAAFQNHKLVLVTSNKLVEEVFCPIFNKIFVINSDAKDLILLKQLYSLKKFVQDSGKVSCMLVASRVNILWVQLFRFLLHPEKIIFDSHPPATVSDLDVNLKMAKEIAPALELFPYIPVSNELMKHTQELLLKNFNIDPNIPKILVYPSREKRNRPLAKLKLLAEAAEYAQKKIQNSIVIVVGADEEKRKWERECNGFKEAHILAGKLTIQETLALCAMSHLVIANDGALMHIAGAMNIPLVAIFTNTPLIYTPPGKKTIVLSPTNLSCASCYPSIPGWCKKLKNNPPCTERITLAGLKETIDKLLG